MCVTEKFIIVEAAQECVWKWCRGGRYGRWRHGTIHMVEEARVKWCNWWRHGNDVNGGVITHAMVEMAVATGTSTDIKINRGALSRQLNIEPIILTW